MKYQNLKMKEPVCDGLSLDALLIQPIQRIPHYCLFLQRFMSCTPTDHVDYVNLRVALDRMEEVAVEINTAAEIQKDRDVLLQVIDKFEISTDPLIKPGRKFLAETDIQKVVRTGIAKRRHLYLFNDILIVAHPQIGQFRINHTNYAVLKLKSTIVTDIPDGRYTNLFGISSAEYSFTAIATSQEHKTEWVNLMGATIREAQYMAQHKFSQVKPVAVSFQPDYEAKSCTLCDEKFTLTYRRHHCRQCGRVACQACSKYKRELAGRQKQVRVCCVCITKPQDWRPHGQSTEISNNNRDELSQLPTLPEQKQEQTTLTRLSNIKSRLNLDKSPAAKFFDDRRESRQDLRPEFLQESRRESGADVGVSDSDKSSELSEKSPEKTTPREKKPREKRALTEKFPREKSGPQKIVKKTREKSSLQRAITEKSFENAENSEFGTENSNLKNSTRRKVDSGEIIFGSPRSRTKKGKIPKDEIDENPENLLRKEDFEELSDEHEHVAYVIKNFPDGVDVWLEIIAKIANGKLDPRKFPKNRNELNDNKV